MEPVTAKCSRNGFHMISYRVTYDIVTVESLTSVGGV